MTRAPAPVSRFRRDFCLGPCQPFLLVINQLVKISVGTPKIARSETEADALSHGRGRKVAEAQLHRIRGAVCEKSWRIVGYGCQVSHPFNDSCHEAAVDTQFYRSEIQFSLTILDHDLNDGIQSDTSPRWRYFPHERCGG